MGASASVDQGRPTGAHEGDIGSSGSEKQYDWSPSKQAEAKQNTHPLQEKLESYNGAQRVAEEERDNADRKQKREDRPPDDSSSSSDGDDVILEYQRRHATSTRQRARSPTLPIHSSSSDVEDQQQHAGRQRKKTKGTSTFA